MALSLSDALDEVKVHEIPASRASLGYLQGQSYVNCSLKVVHDDLKYRCRHKTPGMSSILLVSVVMAEKGRQLDLTSSGEPPSLGTSAENAFLGIHFVCCDVYSRVYANRDRSAYVGHCPRCAKRVQFQVGAGGTDSRFFSVS